MNREGLREVVIDVYQLGGQRVTVGTAVRVKEQDFRLGKVQSSNPDYDLLNRKIRRLIRRLMEHEDELEASGVDPSPLMIKEAFANKTSKTSTISEFVDSVIMKSSRRCNSTKQGYHCLCKSINEFRQNTTISDIDHDYIERYRSFMSDNGLSENTVIGRLKLLRCVCSEALKRNVIRDDPFKFVVIGNMRPKDVYLSLSEIARIERVKLKGKKEYVRDLFLLGCWTGLRFSDLSTLEEAEIKGGILIKRMYKTKKIVRIPINTLFWGKGMNIIERYPDIRVLSKCTCNSTANKMLKEIAVMARIGKSISFHYGRKSCSTNLSLMGMPIQNITSILGQSRTRVTETHYTFDKDKAAEKMAKKLFRKRK